MSFIIKAATTLVATTALVGLGSLASTASAATLTPTGSVDSDWQGSTNGFHITNMSSDTLTLKRIDGNARFESAPAVGSVLRPGTEADFEMEYVTGDDHSNFTYSNQQGNEVIIRTEVEGGTIPSSDCLASHYDCSRPFVHQKYVTITDKNATTREFNGTQAQDEKAIVEQLCANNSAATCKFTPEGPEEKVFGKPRALASHENDSDTVDHQKVIQKDSVEASNSIDVSVSAGSKLTVFGQEIDLEIKTAYGHEWSTGHEFAVSVDMEVEPGTTGVFYAQAPMLRHTGTVTVTYGKTTWKLHGIHFDTPDPLGEVRTYHTTHHND